MLLTVRKVHCITFFTIINILLAYHVLRDANFLCLKRGGDCDNNFKPKKKIDLITITDYCLGFFFYLIYPLGNVEIERVFFLSL